MSARKIRVGSWELRHHILRPSRCLLQTHSRRLQTAISPPQDPIITFQLTAHPPTPHSPPKDDTLRTVAIHRCLLRAAGGPLEALVTAPFAESEMSEIVIHETFESFDVVRRFLYCEPIHMLKLPSDLPLVADRWGLSTLFEACFAHAEERAHAHASVPKLSVAELIIKYVPIMAIVDVPDRFKTYLALRFGIEIKTIDAYFKKHPVTPTSVDDICCIQHDNSVTCRRRRASVCAGKDQQPCTTIENAYAQSASVKCMGELVEATDETRPLTDTDTEADTPDNHFQSSPISVPVSTSVSNNPIVQTPGESTNSPQQPSPEPLPISEENMNSIRAEDANGISTTAINVGPNDTYLDEKDDPNTETSATTFGDIEAASAEVHGAETNSITADTTEADTTEADAIEADATKADATEPDTIEPDATEPDATEPDATESDATEAVGTEANNIEAYGANGTDIGRTEVAGASCEVADTHVDNTTGEAVNGNDTPDAESTAASVTADPPPEDTSDGLSNDADQTASSGEEGYVHDGSLSDMSVPDESTREEREASDVEREESEEETEDIMTSEAPQRADWHDNFDIWQVFQSRAMLDEVFHYLSYYGPDDYTPLILDVVLRILEPKLSDDEITRLLREIDWEWENPSCQTLNSKSAESWSARAWRLLACARLGFSGSGSDIRMSWNYNELCRDMHIRATELADRSNNDSDSDSSHSSVDDDTDFTADWGGRAGDEHFEFSMSLQCESMTLDKLSHLNLRIRLIERDDAPLDKQAGRRDVSARIRVIESGCGCDLPYGSNNRNYQGFKAIPSKNLDPRMTLWHYKENGGNHEIMCSDDLGAWMKRHRKQCGLVFQVRVYVYPLDDDDDGKKKAAQLGDQDKIDCTCGYCECESCDLEDNFGNQEEQEI